MDNFEMYWLHTEPARNWTVRIDVRPDEMHDPELALRRAFSEYVDEFDELPQERKEELHYSFELYLEYEMEEDLQLITQSGRVE